MPGWRLEPDWVPGAIGDLAALHARHYAASHGFDRVFEAKVAGDLAEFLGRRDPARDWFRCVVVGDACASYFPEFHAAGLAMIKAQGGIFGWVTDSTALAQAFA